MDMTSQMAGVMLEEIRAILGRGDLELPDYEALATLVAELDGCLSAGGSLPAAWERSALCQYRIAGEPDPCSCEIERVGDRWRHHYRRIDSWHAAVR